MRKTALACGLMAALASPAAGYGPVGLPPAPVPLPGSPLDGQAGRTGGTKQSLALSWAEDADARYFNRRMKLPWAHEGGDWLDADDVPQGPRAFAVAEAAGETVAIDVTALVRQHGADFMLRAPGLSFAGRRSATPPRLSVTRGNRTTDHQANTEAAIGGVTLLRFAQPADSSISRAMLTLTIAAPPAGATRIAVFRPDPRASMPSPVKADGTAADMLFRRRGDNWQLDISDGSLPPTRSRFNPDGSLTVWVPIGAATGANSVYRLPPTARRERLFARTVMKLHEDFTPAIGGKLPGLSNTGMGDRRPIRAGWGGRGADGTQWSARTNRFPVAPGAKRMDFGPYVYRLNGRTRHGEGTPAVQGLPIGRFFTLDQMVKLNTIGPDGRPNDDGEIAYWIDGVCVSHMTGIRFRDNARPETLPSEYWLDVYVGGTGYKAPYLHHVTFREVVISSRLLPFKPGGGV